MRSIASSALVVVLALSGCTTTVTQTPLVEAATPSSLEEPITAVIAAALDADRRLEPADSLWDPEATIIAGGVERYAPPRFAGVEPGGEVAITSTRLDVRSALAWVYVEYRWISLNEAGAREGRATVLLVPRPDGRGWKITHTHSSVAP
jgi:hypothetical protein